LSSLSEHLNDKSGGNILRGYDATTHDAFQAAAGKAIIAPSSGKRMAIMQIIISPIGVGANGTVIVGLTPSAASATEDELLFGEFFCAAQAPIILNLSDCPIMTTADQALKAKIGGTAATGASVSAIAYEVG